MIKVLQVINSLSSGGAEVFASQLSVALAKKVEVKVLTYAGELDEKGRSLKDYLINNKIEYLSLNAKSHFHRLLVPFLILREVVKFKPDVIHVHLERCEQFVFIASLLCSIRLIAVRTKHNTRVYPDGFLRKRLDKFFVKNIACSYAAYAALVEMGLSDKSVIITNGIEIKPEAQLATVDKSILRHSLGLPNEKVIILHTGSMHGELAKSPKAQDVILKSLSLCDFKEKVVIVFLGGGNNLEPLKTMASDLGLNQSVCFKGIVPNVQDYLKCADFFILPSRAEGLPIAAIEAACSSLPMIVSDIEPFNDFSHKSIIKCTVDSPESLATALQEMLGNLQHYKNNALDTAKDFQTQYSIDAVADKHISLYQGLIGG